MQFARIALNELIGAINAIVQLIHCFIRRIKVSYTLPVFNVSCNIKHNYSGSTFPPPGPYDMHVACHCRGTPPPSYVVNALWGGGNPLTVLMFPKLFDVRMSGAGQDPDYIEFPADSGAWWQVISVFDIGKGFANEHRAAVLSGLTGVSGGWTWPMP